MTRSFRIIADLPKAFFEELAMLVRFSDIPPGVSADCFFVKALLSPTDHATLEPLGIRIPQGGFCGTHVLHSQRYAYFDGTTFGQRRLKCNKRRLRGSHCGRISDELALVQSFQGSHEFVCRNRSPADKLQIALRFWESAAFSERQGSSMALVRPASDPSKLVHLCQVLQITDQTFGFRNEEPLCRCSSSTRSIFDVCALYTPISRRP